MGGQVIAVCADDPEFKDYNDISELPPFRIAEIRGFFQDYKKLEGKVVSVEELEGRDSGVRAVKEAMDLYTAMVVRDLQS
jgi:inorganic pyrophosphatase